MTRQRILVFITLLVLAVSASCSARFPTAPTTTTAQAETQLLVSAAASLTDALNELAPLYQQAHAHETVRYNFGGSGALQQQIENGAPADVFIAAAAKQMNALQKKDLLLTDTRRTLLTNRLVLVVPANASGVTDLESLMADGVKRIAIGDPRSVPAGQYAEEALTKANLWQQLKPKYVLANNVRQVLQFVAAGNADAGLVYLTDAKTTNKVKIVQTIPETLHAPIVYPIAVLKNSRNQTTAKAFLEFLLSSAAKAVFVKYGFTTT